MSFWPFPKTILDELRAGLAVGSGIDFGSGDGRLNRRLRGIGFDLVAADLNPPCELRLDVRALPFRRESLGLVLLANLLRHLGFEERIGLLHGLRECLAPDGRVVILEDDLRARSAGEQNYRRVLELLAEADPSRGAAFDPASLFRDLPEGLVVTCDGVHENQETVLDPVAPLRWLSARGYAGRPDFEALEDAVARDGILYGPFRACVLARR